MLPNFRCRQDRALKHRPMLPGCPTATWFIQISCVAFATTKYHLMRRPKSTTLRCPSIKWTNSSLRNYTHRYTKTTNCSLLKNKSFAMHSSRLQLSFCKMSWRTRTLTVKRTSTSSRISCKRCSRLLRRSSSRWLQTAQSKSTSRKSKTCSSWYSIALNVRWFKS